MPKKNSLDLVIEEIKKEIDEVEVRIVASRKILDRLLKIRGEQLKNNNSSL